MGKSSDRQFSRPPAKIALIAIFTALSLGTNYVMIDFWNVKLMDSLVFIAAFLFGLQVGLGSAISTWIVYGYVNPYGVDDPVLLLFLIAGECFYAIAGTLLSRASFSRGILNRARSDYIEASSRITLIPISQSDHKLPWSQLMRMEEIRRHLRRIYARILPYGRLSLLFALVGFQATFAYDVLTNFASWIFKTSSLYQALVIGNIVGVPFAILHEASNLVFFSTVVPLAIATARRFGITIQDRGASRC